MICLVHLYRGEGDGDGEGVDVDELALAGSGLANCHSKQVPPPLAAITVGRGWWSHVAGQPGRGRTGGRERWSWRRHPARRAPWLGRTGGRWRWRHTPRRRAP